MKKINVALVLIAAIVAVAGMQATAHAALITFLVHDVNGDESAIIEADTFGTNKTLEYSTDNANWDAFSGTGPIVTKSFFTPANGSQQVWLRLSQGNSTDTDGTMSFLGSNDSGLYSSVIVQWTSGGGGQFTFAAPNNGDLISAVPIPASALLLFSGLIGLVGFHRRRAKM
jgi:hypothetical protein